jgi:putative glutamine amidotransferase
MARSRPRIGVTGPDRGGAVAWWFTRLALWRAGAAARRLRPRKFAGADAGDPLDGIDGVVLGGGADVDPARYGETPLDPPLDREEKRIVRLRHRVAGFFVHLLRRVLRVRETPAGDAARDEFETRVLDAALARGLPVLGICRGAQLLAVHLGGTLAQDLSAFYTERPNPRTPLPRKRVQTCAGTRLRAVLDAERCLVNALHDQAIRDPGPHLEVAAREENGVIQAVERPGNGFVVGVQWHPEYLPLVKRQQRLFRALVDAAAGR